MFLGFRDWGLEGLGFLGFLGLRFFSVFRV